MVIFDALLQTPSASSRVLFPYETLCDGQNVNKEFHRRKTLEVFVEFLYLLLLYKYFFFRTTEDVFQTNGTLVPYEYQC